MSVKKFSNVQENSELQGKSTNFVFLRIVRKVRIARKISNVQKKVRIARKVSNVQKKVRIARKVSNVQKMSELREKSVMCKKCQNCEKSQ